MLIFLDATSISTCVKSRRNVPPIHMGWVWGTRVVPYTWMAFGSMERMPWTMKIINLVLVTKWIPVVLDTLWRNRGWMIDGWLMMVDDGWLMFDDVWCWLMMVDVGWWWLMCFLHKNKRCWYCWFLSLPSCLCVCEKIEQLHECWHQVPLTRCPLKLWIFPVSRDTVFDLWNLWSHQGSTLENNKIIGDFPVTCMNVKWAKKKSGWLGYIGIILPTYMGIIISHYKDPYETTIIMETKRVF